MTAKRDIIRIDESKCDGCALCAQACAEGAIQIVNGKAKLISEIYCDGLGACLGQCPQGAITIEKRAAQAFDEEATRKHLQKPPASQPEPQAHGHACPGMKMRQMKPVQKTVAGNGTATPSQLGNWPVQLKLVPTNAPYFQGADLLLVADCVPFALADFHQRFLQGKPVIIGCPKLDDGQFYMDKLTRILSENPIHSLTIIHMEVPCCTGLVRIAQQALAASGKQIITQDVTIGINGEVQTQTGSAACCH